MARITGNVHINAPVHEVFEYVSDWQNVQRFYEGIIDYTREPSCEVECGDGARYCCTVRSPIAGNVNYVLETSDFAENHGWTLKSVDGPPLEEHWWFEDLPGRPRVTRLNYDIQYKVPIPVVGGLLDRMLIRNEWNKRVSKSLNNIRDQVEDARAARRAGTSSAT